MKIQSILITLGSVFLLLACSTVSPEPKSEKIAQKHKKVFEEEDMLIMYALRAEELHDFKGASDIFDSLYEKSEKKEYLYRSLQNSLFIKENEKVIEQVNSIAQGSYEDFALVRLKIVALIQNESYDKALQESLKLVSFSKAEDDYIMVSDIYTAKREFELARKYLESAYMREFSERILDRLSIILYVNLRQTKDAIALLETHTRIHGCSKLICKRLISFYSNENNTDGLLNALLRFYKIDPDEAVAKRIVQLYAYKKDFNKMMLFLEDSNSDDKTLLQIYLANKNYLKAAPLAKKIYETTGEVKYLGESIIYEYEVQEDKNDKEFLKGISKKFENLLKMKTDALYFNYYGYILIDHDLDVPKGITYIKKALKLEPDSVYYLDSLAWGLYKTGQCKKSMDVMQKVLKLEGGNDPEVLDHYEKIKTCKGKNER